MKLKNILCVFCFIGLVACIVVLLCLSRKEPFQPPHDDIVHIIDKFCNKHYGDDWGIDNIYPYNDKIVFAVIQTKGSTIDLSIQPENRAIIIENINGKTPPQQRRISRF